MSFNGDGFDLRFVPRPNRRNILRLKPPSGLRGMGFEAGVSEFGEGRVRGRAAKDGSARAIYVCGENEG